MGEQEREDFFKEIKKQLVISLVGYILVSFTALMAFVITTKVELAEIKTIQEDNRRSIEKAEARIFYMETHFKSFPQP